MEIQGRVIEVMPIQSGVGKNSGREWSSQEFIIEYNQNTQYPRNACLRIFGSDRISEINIQNGEYVSVMFDVESSKYMDRWYTRLNAYRVTRVQPGAPAPTNNQPNNDVPPITLNDAPMGIQKGIDRQNAQQQYQSSVPTPPPFSGTPVMPEEEHKDDLPF